MNKKNEALKKDILISLVSFLMSLCVLTFFLVKLRITPFGTKTLTTEDINYSLIDQWGYLKNILSGRANLGYSFNMALGGNTANVFSYALSSPINLLLAFFGFEDFNLFFTCCVYIKLSLIAFSVTFYIRRRFANTEIKPFFAVILGLSCAFSQYSAYQIVNIFWLDGVIILPFILLGIYRIIQTDKPFLLIFSVALALIFNWYSGIICCIFSIFWFLFEMALYIFNNETKHLIKFSIKKGLMYAGGGIIGSLLSFWILLPTFFAVKNGNRGTINTEMLSLKLNGKISTVISNDIIGGMSSTNIVSLFCGSFAIVGCIGYFGLKKISFRNKMIHIVMILFIVMTFYWQPLYLLFSMMKVVSSYWSRYSFIGVFTIIFIAAEFFSEWFNEADFSLEYPIVFIILLAFLNVKNSEINIKLLLVTISCYLLSVVLLVRIKKEIINYKKFFLIFLSLCLCCIESFLNIYYLIKDLDIPDIVSYKEYVNEETNMIETIKKFDENDYRLNKTLTRNMKGGRATANYNEAFMYNYKGISGYTNSPDDRQRLLLDHLGYRINGENYYIVNTSVIPSDSLLGVKYFLSDYIVNGYEKIEWMGIHNNKEVYYNPFYLPMAFYYNNDYINSIEYNNNTFEYINKIYSKFVGSDVDLFVKLHISSEIIDNSIVYNISIPEGNYAVYGNIISNQEMKAEIRDENGDFLTLYSRWGAPSVFYIPSNNEQINTKITMNTQNGLSIVDEQFYALDLDLFNEIVTNIRTNAVDFVNVKDNKCVIDVTLNSKKMLFTSIAYDNGWVITDNGKKIEPILFENCLMQFDLSEGSHHIVMKYNIPGLFLGCIASVLGMVLLLIYYFVNKIKTDSI